MAGAGTEVVIARVDDLLARLVLGGLRHCGRELVGELEAAVQTAHHAKLVRVERELAALATQLDRYAARDPTFRPWAWAAACNRCWTLLRAAERVSPDEAERERVWGVHRRRYEPRGGPVVVQAVAASGWVTDSGFVGITVHLWAPDEGRLLQATLARPSAAFGVEPRRLLFQPVSEVTPLTLHELSHGAWVLDDVRVSTDGRLSLHHGLQVHSAPPMLAAATRRLRVEGFDGAVDRVVGEEIRPVPSGEGDPILVEIASIGPVFLDRTHARATCELRDRAGTRARVVVPLRPESDVLVDNLGRLGTSPPAALVGRFAVVGGELRFDPWTALYDQPQALGFRRARRVQEVHLGLEPLPGDPVTADGAPPKGRESPPDAATLGLEEVRELLVELWSAGLAATDRDVREALVETASSAEALHPRLAGALSSLAGHLGGAAAPDALQRATSHLRLLLAAWSVERARRVDRAPVSAAPRRGEDLDVVPLGAELDHGELVIHALDATGEAVELRDRVDGSPAAGIRLDQPTSSHLFQDRVLLGEVLRRRIRLVDHPTTRSRGRRVARPAWNTRPVPTDLVEAPVLPLLEAPRRGAPFRMRVTARRGPAGWSLLGATGELDVVVDELLAFDLEKRAALGRRVLDVVLVARGDRLRMLRVEGTFPAVDPAATLWSAELLRARAGDDPALRTAVDAATGRAGPVEDAPRDELVDAARGFGEAGRSWLAERVAAEVAAVREGEPLPAATRLWAWGRALDPSAPPIDTVGLPVDRLRAAIVGPLGRWLAGGDPDAETLDALRLLAGTDQRSVVVVGR